MDGGLVFLFPWGVVGRWVNVFGEAALGHRGDQHLQQAVVLASAGSAVAVLRCSLDEFHAHFVLLELDQEPATHRETRWETFQVGNESPCEGRNFTLLLVWDVYVELLPVGGRGPSAVEFGDDLDQMFAAQ